MTKGGQVSRTTRILSVVMLAAAAAFFAGCGKAEEKPVAAKPAETPAVDISTLQEFLRYPGAAAIERMAVNTEDSKGTVWTLVSDDPRAQVEDWYKTSVNCRAGALRSSTPASAGIPPCRDGCTLAQCLALPAGADAHCLRVERRHAGPRHAGCPA